VEAPEQEATEPTTPSRRKPLGLIAAFVLVAGAAIAAGVYAGWLDQQRQLLQIQLAQDERRILDLREALTRAEVAVQEKQAALATRDVALEEATQPELPVRVSFRPAWMGQGMVATFRNVAAEPISLMVEVRDPQAHRSKAFAFDIRAGASADIGHAQGWLVTSGQSLKVAATGYKTVTAFAP
jgi:ferric-dicitrate binding protein FerR (iron transport regulator)